MEKKDVMISMTSQAYRDDETDAPIKLVTKGKLYIEENGWSIEYQENIDESAPAQDIIFSVNGNRASMERAGTYATNMVFEKDKRYEGIFNTPYGVMDIALFCTKMKAELNSDGGHIHVKYQLDMNGQFVSMHEIQFVIAVING